MTSRDRVMASLNFKQPDRVPIDFNGHRSSGISVLAYKNLRNYLELPPSPLYVYDFIQQLAIVEQDVLDLFGVDTLQLGCDFDGYPEYWRDWVMQDGTPCKIPAFIDVRKTTEGNVIYSKNGKPIGIQKPGCLYYEQTCFPLADDFDKEDFSDLAAINEDIIWATVATPPMPIDYATPQGAKKLREIAARTHGSTDRAIYGIFGGNLVENGQFTFRMDNFLCEMLANPPRVHQYLDALLDMHMQNLENYLNAVGDYIDVIGFGDDMGTQNGPQFSPALYEEFFKPRQQKMWSYVHERFPKMKICLHCCGGVQPLLLPLADAGLDAINPVQFTCMDMDISKLKEDLYGKLTLWGGGCDTRDFLPHGTAAEVADHVQKQVSILHKGGGFVFQQVHNIMADVPPENIVAMLKNIQV